MEAKRLLAVLMAAGSLVVPVLLSTPVSAGGPSNLEAPSEGMHPSEFATEHRGCLGPLRSAIARGEFDGVGPFGKHFTGDVNPGVLQGTVGEEEFLKETLGIEDIDAFCDQFE